MKRLLLFFVALFVSTAAFAALQFPALTGRVVDDAHILSSPTVDSLDTMLEDYEGGTSNQVVVVTLSSLQDDSIEDYGYQLGRYWGIGQKGKNNGVLLIVAPQEHKVRIEVGYGLEGTLTDAISSEIVHGIILPEFKSGHMSKGIVDGTKAIVSVLGGSGIPADMVQPSQKQQAPGWIIVLIMVLFLWFAIRHPFVTAMVLSNSSFRGGSSGGGFSGGFSGSGGSFGGGGASGSW
jgi:uncharacterized protein